MRSQFDADAIAFIDSAGITGSTQRSVLNQFVKYLKGQGTTNGSNLWPKITALYPYCPINDTTASSTAYSFNLVNPSAFQISWVNFVSGDFDITGVTGGSTKYGATGIIPSTHLLLNDIGLSVYSKTDGQFADVAIGVQASALVSRLALSPRNTSTPSLLTHALNQNSNITSIQNPDGRGLLTVQRTGSASTQAYKNNMLLGTTTTSSSSRAGIEIFLHALNSGGNGTGESIRQYAGFSILKSLNANEIEDWFFAWNYYQTNIIPGGRNV